MEEIPQSSDDHVVVKRDLDHLRIDMKHEFQLVRKDMAHEFQLVRQEITQESQLVRKDLELGIKGIEALVAKSNQKMMIQLIGVFALFNGMLFAGVKWV